MWGRIMRQVHSNLWIGNARDARNVPAVMARAFAAVVDLALEEPPAQLPREVAYIRIPLIDGEGNSPAMTQAAIRAIAAFIESGTPTLVVCGGGMSRSPAVTAAAIAQVEGIHPEEALIRIAATGPHDVSTIFWKELISSLDSGSSDSQASVEKPLNKSSDDATNRNLPFRPVRLFVVEGSFAICKLVSGSPIPQWATQSNWFSITRTADELSIVCRQDQVPEGIISEKEWRCLRVAGAMPFSVVGVLASLTTPLAAAGISLFAISTFNTDYLLMKASDFEKAIIVLQAAGHDINHADRAGRKIGNHP
jgi:protein-tyrosine phosphatase